MKECSVNKVFTYSLVFVFCLFTAEHTYAQEIKTGRVDNKELVKFAANLQVVGEHRGKVFLVRLFKVANVPSPFAEHSDEVDHFLYLLVSQYGEANSTNQ